MFFLDVFCELVLASIFGRFLEGRNLEKMHGAYTGARFSRVGAPQNESKNGRKHGFEKKTRTTAILDDFGVHLGGPWDQFFVFFGGQKSIEQLRGFLRGFFGTQGGFGGLA